MNSNHCTPTSFRFCVKYSQPVHWPKRRRELQSAKFYYLICKTIECYSLSSPEHSTSPVYLLYIDIRIIQTTAYSDNLTYKLINQLDSVQYTLAAACLSKIQSQCWKSKCKTLNEHCDVGNKIIRKMRRNKWYNCMRIKIKI